MTNDELKKLNAIDEKLTQILEQLAEGKTKFAVLSWRVRVLELLGYGAVGVVLLYMIQNVLNGHGPV